MTTIHNVPNYAYHYIYIVYREVEGENWFYGAYDNSAKAEAVAEEIGGFIYENFLN